MESARVRFWRSIEFEPITGCWLWSAARNRDGYGVLKANGQSVYAHRFSWAEKHGEIPEGICVLHRCDTPACANPDHLFLGTRGDNARDKSRKGRCHNNKGERHGRSILSEAQAREVLRLIRTGESQSKIAADFGISKTAVCNINTGRRWSHILDAIR